MLKRVLVMFATTLIGTMTVRAGARGSETRIGTAGDFVTSLAVAMGQDGRNVQSAARALERLGMSPIGVAEAPLTERMVAGIAADLGVGVLPPSSPDATVSVARAGVLANLIGMSFVETRGGAAIADLPVECLRSPNRGQCVECCKEIVGQVPNDQGNPRDPGRECAKFCVSNVPPPPSDSEPQP